jgi:hypothetical protein
VKNLPIGVEVAGRVEKQEGHFFRLMIPDSTPSIVLSCRSIGKSKFKLILFDKDGAVRHVQESTSRSKNTSADMFLTHVYNPS